MMFKSGLMTSGAAMLACATIGAIGHPALQLMRRNGVQTGLDLGALIRAVTEFLEDKNAYDPDVPDKCVLAAWTYGGTSCRAELDCTEGGTAVFENWNVCYLNGEQFFHDDRIGDFSITFTQAGGVNSDEDGLHHPVYKLKDFNNWEPWDIEKIMDDHAGQGGGALCNYGGNAAIQEKLWKCGIPLAGTSLFGHSLIGEDTPPDAGYTPGWCTAHVSQYQRGQYGTGERYAFDITLYDGAGAQIGHVQKREVDEGGYLSMTSPLPYTLDLSSGQKDEDPVSFCYAGECWSCDDGNGGAHGCTLGDGPENGYEYGDREGDFGFTC